MLGRSEQHQFVLGGGGGGRRKGKKEQKKQGLSAVGRRNETIKKNISRESLLVTFEGIDQLKMNHFLNRLSFRNSINSLIV